jgi:F420-dependent oxidoreductase-like protein
LGFDTLWTFDHMLPFAGADDGSCFETWTTLAAMAAATGRIRIGALVNGVLYRDPATLAKSAVMVDHISNGRLEFALGAAWAEREFRAYGLPFPPIAERLGRLNEALEIVKALWTQPRTTYHGRYYTIQDAPCEPKPVQRPYPPIMVGGRGKATLRIAARHATVWNGVGSPETLTGAIRVLHEACAAIGRDPAEIELTSHPSLAIAPTHAAAEEQALAAARSADINLDDERDRWLIGTPEEIRAGIQRHIDIGITHWIMAVAAPFDRAMLALFAREVIPAFRR